MTSLPPGRGTARPERLGAPPLSASRFLVFGYSRTGAAVTEVLARYRASVAVADDRPEAFFGLETAVPLGVTLYPGPPPSLLDQLVADAELVVVAPGVTPHHRVFGAARRHGREVISEIELACRLGAAPLVAVTGTNGKTTVTELVAAMLTASGRRAQAVGNIGTPLVSTVGSASEAELVLEVSSAQLAYTTSLSPRIAVLLNLTPDHLDWHGSIGAYRAAKARIFANQGPTDVAIANAEDPVALELARGSRARLVTFGLWTGDYTEVGERLETPDGALIASRQDLSRSLPHDRLNALAASAAALCGGASLERCGDTLKSFVVGPHRLQLVAEIDGVAFYDDSKATSPAAVSAALAGFSSAVLILGGRNKGLDLGAIRLELEKARRGPHPSEMTGARSLARERSGGSGDVSWREPAEEQDRGEAVIGAPASCELAGVVAIGEATDEVCAVFEGYCPLRRATSMEEAVEEAFGLARRGDAVLLSPGCASFDWYDSYVARGEEFQRVVGALEAREARRPRDRAPAGNWEETSVWRR